MVLVDAGWRTAMELALAQPDLVMLTRDGDRLGGDAPWRIGGAAATVTQAAFEEAVAQVGVVEAERADAATLVERGHALSSTPHVARATESLALEHRRTMISERLAGLLVDVRCSWRVTVQRAGAGGAPAGQPRGAWAPPTRSSGCATRRFLYVGR